ncbi:MAG: GntR family transcriptional regulator [Planctomycetales bacterium]|jgi:GntR family transcriptional regulator
MQIHITEADGTPYYQQVVNQVKFLVASGRLEEGEQLPPVRRLAEQLLVNPNTVARAYRELESEGVVASKRGAGVFVSNAGSPLSQKEKTRILHERIDALLAESSQLGVSVDSLLKLIEQRNRKLETTRGGKS